MEEKGSWSEQWDDGSNKQQPEIKKEGKHPAKPRAERRKIIQKLKKSFIWIEGEVLHKWVRQAMGTNHKKRLSKMSASCTYILLEYTLSTSDPHTQYESK